MNVLGRSLLPAELSNVPHADAAGAEQGRYRYPGARLSLQNIIRTLRDAKRQHACLPVPYRPVAEPPVIPRWFSNASGQLALWFQQLGAQSRDISAPPPVPAEDLVPPAPIGVWVPISGGHFVVVDREDFEIASKHRWTALVDSHTVYARRTVKAERGRTSLLLHRLLTGAGPGQIVDHRNCDGLDNRKRNLRITDALGNSWNKRKSARAQTPYKGASKQTSRGKWSASIRVAGKQIRLGTFDTAEDAHAAYVAAAKQYFGEFARAG